MNRTIHTVTWRKQFNPRLNEDLKFDIDVYDGMVASVGHPIMNWSLDQPWHSTYSWLIKKEATITSVEMGPHATYEEFRSGFSDHVVARSEDKMPDEEYIKGAYTFYIGQSKDKEVRAFLRSFITGTKKSMDDIYFVEVK